MYSGKKWAAPIVGKKGDRHGFFQGAREKLAELEGIQLQEQNKQT